MHATPRRRAAQRHRERRQSESRTGRRYADASACDVATASPARLMPRSVIGSAIGKEPMVGGTVDADVQYAAVLPRERRRGKGVEPKLDIARRRYERLRNDPEPCTCVERAVVA